MNREIWLLVTIFQNITDRDYSILLNNFHRDKSFLKVAPCIKIGKITLFNKIFL